MLRFYHPHPKDPAVLKYYGVVIYYHRSNSLVVEISCEVFPGPQGASETLPSCFTTVVVFCYHHSELV